jgi:hypothetical protein
LSKKPFGQAHPFIYKKGVKTDYISEKEVSGKEQKYSKYCIQYKGVNVYVKFLFKQWEKLAHRPMTPE